MSELWGYKVYSHLVLSTENSRAAVLRQLLFVVLVLLGWLAHRDHFVNCRWVFSIIGDTLVFLWHMWGDCEITWFSSPPEPRTCLFIPKVSMFKVKVTGECEVESLLCMERILQTFMFLQAYATSLYQVLLLKSKVLRFDAIVFF